MTLQQFLKTVALILAGSGLNIIVTARYQIKTGMIYENEKGNYIITYYDTPKDGCFVLRTIEYDKNFKEVRNEEFYSEDDVSMLLDSFKHLKESKLNQELISLFNDIVSYLKEKETKVVN
jgi:hypothetical protein